MVHIIRRGKKKSMLRQIEERLKQSKKKRKQPDWDKFFGKVQWKEDPVEYQRRIRDEWN